MPYPRNKFHAKKVVVDGVTYASKHEYQVWCELALREKAGEISDLKFQVPFNLIPAQYEEIPRFSKRTGAPLKPKRRCLERACDYVADFTYTEDGKYRVVDAKGERTKDYIIKRKLMLWVHGIRIMEV